MARLKYYDAASGEWKYADVAVESSLPTATDDKDILYWDDTNAEWVAGAITNVIPNGDNLSY